MSNFLNKFTDQSYKDTLDQKRQPEPKLEKKKDKSKKEKKELPEERVIVSSQPIQYTRTEYSEETVKDPGYKKAQQRKVLFITLAIVILFSVGGAFYYFLNQVRIPDYTNQPLSDLKTWANRNDITLDVTEEFSLEISQDYIISTTPVANEKLQKGSILAVLVSAGTDPEEVIVIPDFTGMSSYEIQTWLDTNKANNLRFTYEYNDTIASDLFISIKFSDTSTNLDNYKRKQYGIITISRGPEVFEKNIEMPDWATTHVSLETAQTWASSKGVKLTINMVESSLTVNSIVSQSVAAKEMVAKNDTVLINVSKGILVTVPDFKLLNMTDALEKASSLDALTNVDVHFIKMYNDTNAYGTYIWQDVNAGTKIDQTSTKAFVLNVYFSLGKPFIVSQVGVSEPSFVEYIYGLNLDSAQLTTTVTYKNCTSVAGAVKGNVCAMTKYNEYVPVGTNIDVIVHSPTASTTY